MFKIITPNEAIPISNVTVMYYGQGGAGKTTLAATSGNKDEVIILDFDGFSHRAMGQPFILRTDSYADIKNNWTLFVDKIQQYNVIAVDTVGRMVDSMIQYFTDKEPKLLYNNLKLYGHVKTEVNLLTNKILSLKKDIILLSHEREKEEGEARTKRPFIPGASYEMLFSIADFVGYLWQSDKRRYLDFNTTQSYLCKNTAAAFDKMDIPDYNKDPMFNAKLLKVMREAVNKDYGKHLETAGKVQMYKDELLAAADVDTYNNICKDIANENTNILTQLRGFVSDTAKSRGYVFDKVTKYFVNNNIETPNKVSNVPFYDG